jgi:hypothetical protein
MEQIEECQPWSALDLQEPPEAFLVFLAQVFLGNRVEKAEIESDCPSEGCALELEPAEGVLAPIIRTSAADVEVRVQEEGLGTFEVHIGIVLRGEYAEVSIAELFAGHPQG